MQVMLEFKLGMLWIALDPQASTPVSLVSMQGMLESKVQTLENTPENMLAK